MQNVHLIRKRYPKSAALIITILVIVLISALLIGLGFLFMF